MAREWQAGPELDAEIAARLELPLAPFSTELMAAWGIVDACILRERGLYIETPDATVPGYYVATYDTDGEMSVAWPDYCRIGVAAPTLPLALCRMILAALDSIADHERVEAEAATRLPSMARPLPDTYAEALRVVMCLPGVVGVRYDLAGQTGAPTSLSGIVAMVERDDTAIPESAHGIAVRREVVRGESGWAC